MVFGAGVFGVSDGVEGFVSGVVVLEVSVVAFVVVDVVSVLSVWG